MNACAAWLPTTAALAGLTALIGISHARPTNFGFMPDGGRGLLSQVFPNPAAVRTALAEGGSLGAWRHRIAAAAPDLDPKEARTLAGYLALNAPLIAAALGTDPEGALPPDGKDLALRHCQSCHSLYSGYLTTRRSAAGWRAIFRSPFHKGITLSPTEIKTFADYSTINMPLRDEDVPARLRY